MLVYVLFVLLYQGWQLSLLFPCQKVIFLYLLQLQRQQLLLLYLHRLCFLQDQFSLSANKKLRQLNRVQDRVPLSLQVVKTNFMRQDLLFVFVQKAKLIYLLLTQVFYLYSIYVVVLQFPQNITISYCLHQHIQLLPSMNGNTLSHIHQICSLISPSPHLASSQTHCSHPPNFSICDLQQIKTYCFSELPSPLCSYHHFKNLWLALWFFWKIMISPVIF